MLVGQKVPYRQKVEFSESEKDRWKNLRLKWATVANRGITMHDYLAGLRSGEVQITTRRLPGMK